MKLRINKMAIQNFMGIKELDLKFDGKDAVISGENGTGKTTIKTAFSWVLFDKNTFGDTKFGIKPVDSDGNTIHNLETSVEIEFDIDGNANTYKRTMIEKWTRKRGEVTTTFTGNENSYFINGVPKKKTEYNAEIKSLISEDMFKTITDPLYFNEQLDWKSRRNILMEICGNISDEDVIRSNPKLNPLLTILQSRSLEEHIEMLKSSMKKINSELGLIPAKITEAERAISNVDDIDMNNCLSELGKLEELADKLREKKSEILNGAELVNLKAKKRDLESQISTKPFDLTSVPEYEKRELLLKQYDDTQKKISEYTNEVLTADSKIDAIKTRKKSLSNQWDVVSSYTFTGDICPTCRQMLPANEREEKRKAFNLDKSKKLDDIENSLKEANSEFEKLKASADYYNDLIEKEQKSVILLQNEIGLLYNTILEEKRKYMSEQELNNDDLRKRIDSLADEISNYDKTIMEKVEPIDSEIDDITNKCDKVREDIAMLKTADRQRGRIEELQREQMDLSSEYMSHENNLYICEQFIKQKVEMLNDNINSKFKVARFKLFDIQVNGGLVETCETTYLGVPYKDMNNAARVNVGLEIINVLCEHNGVTAPIFLDNMESVNNPVETASQQIKLYVSTDKTLKIKIGEK